jgi:IS5 family transposase
MLYRLTRGRSGRITTGADKACDTRDFVSTVRKLAVTPHVARRQNMARSTSERARIRVSLSKRWLVEKRFEWLKQIGPLKKVQLRGLAKVDWLFVFSCTAFNLIRIPKLRAQSA